MKIPALRIAEDVVALVGVGLTTYGSTHSWSDALEAAASAPAARALVTAFLSLRGKPGRHEAV